MSYDVAMVLPPEHPWCIQKICNWIKWRDTFGCCCCKSKSIFFQHHRHISSDLCSHRGKLIANQLKPNFCLKELHRFLTAQKGITFASITDWIKIFFFDWKLPYQRPFLPVFVRLVSFIWCARLLAIQFKCFSFRIKKKNDFWLYFFCSTQSKQPHNT